MEITSLCVYSITQLIGFMGLDTVSVGNSGREQTSIVSILLMHLLVHAVTFKLF